MLQSIEEAFSFQIFSYSKICHKGHSFKDRGRYCGELAEVQLLDFHIVRKESG